LLTGTPIYVTIIPVLIPALLAAVDCTSLPRNLLNQPQQLSDCLQSRHTPIMPKWTSASILILTIYSRSRETEKLNVYHRVNSHSLIHIIEDQAV
jgi:hypothetical protein